MKARIDASATEAALIAMAFQVSAADLLRDGWTVPELREQIRRFVSRLKLRTPKK